MIIEGKYTSAKVFTDNCDANAQSQILTLCNQKCMDNIPIRIMPDVHAGTGCTIGTTFPIKDKIIPNLVGVDISCGMLTVKLKDKKIDLQKLDKLISQYIPSGFNKRTLKHPYVRFLHVEELRCLKNLAIQYDTQLLAIGTLGGGNHFIELDKDEEDNLYLVIHTGSRNLGKCVAEYYQQAAYDALHGKDSYHKEQKKKQIRELIDRLTSEGRKKEISKAIKQFQYDPMIASEIFDIPFELSYCEGQLFEDYIHDMKILQEYAYINRAAIADTIQSGVGYKQDYQFDTIHNYIDLDKMILRKGAISANKGELATIPMNMRDGSLIVRGKGNPDWNYSAPHGAGRLMSRFEARNSIPMKEFKHSMEGIYSSSVNVNTVDEAPQAYKPMQEIIDNIKDTVDIVRIIKPIYNFKAH